MLISLFLIPLLILFSLPVSLYAKSNAPNDFQELRALLLRGVSPDWAISRMKEIFKTQEDHQFLDQLLRDQIAAGSTMLRLQSITQKNSFLEVTLPGGKKYKIKRLKDNAIQIHGQTISLQTSAKDYVNAFHKAISSKPIAGLIRDLPLSIFALSSITAEAQMLEGAVLVMTLAAGYALKEPMYNLGQKARLAVLGQSKAAANKPLPVAELWMVYLKRDCRSQSEEPNRKPYSQSEVYRILKALAQKNPRLFDLVNLTPKGPCDANHISEVIKTETLNETEGRDVKEFCDNEAKFFECMRKYRDSSSEAASPAVSESPANK